MAYPIARRSFLPFVSLFAKQVSGTENIPTDTAVVVAANHLGMFDPLFIGSLYIRRTTKKLRYLVDTRNLFWKTIGFFFQFSTHTIPVRPGKSGQAVEDAVFALRKGDSVGVFPEGRVNTSPSLLPGRSGAVRMSLLSGSPILPVGIENTNVQLLTILLRRLAQRQEGISIRFGVPYQPSGDPSDDAAVRRLTDDLMNRIAALSGKKYEPTYGS